MNIQVIASGSKGNAAIISHGNNKLLLDAGVSIDKICKALDYDLSSLDGCLISHEHKDHSKALPDLIKFSIDCYMSEGTAKALININHNIHIISNDNFSKFLFLGAWTIIPISLIHDSFDNLGFLISIYDECLLYAVDTSYIPCLIQGKGKEKGLIKFFGSAACLTHILIECNYSLDIVREKVKAEELPAFLKNRLLRSHMSLETCKKFLQTNDLKSVKEIWLLHISERHGDKEYFKSEIQKLTGNLVKTI